MKDDTSKKRAGCVDAAHHVLCEAHSGTVSMNHSSAELF